MKQNLKSALLRVAFALALLAPAVGATVWSCFPAARAYYASHVFELPAMSEQEWGDASKTIELRRQMQKHFLSHNIYIPMEDIVVSSGADEASGSGSETRGPANISALMQKACGRGRLYVWIPLKIRVPITGEKVIEWCWKPHASNNT